MVKAKSFEVQTQLGILSTPLLVYIYGNIEMASKNHFIAIEHSYR